MTINGVVIVIKEHQKDKNIISLIPRHRGCDDQNKYDIFIPLYHKINIGFASHK